MESLNMARFEVLIASFVLALAFKSIQCSSAVMHSNVTLMVTSDNKFLMGNSSVKFQSLDNVTIPNGPSQYIRVSYISGRRVFGDRILAAVSDSKQATQSLCFGLHLDFPEYGNSSVPITFIEVIVDQATNYVKGFITRGGIGQKQISIYIEACQTNYFSYTATVYGNNAAINGCCLFLLFFSVVMVYFK